jgi:hypothetical protein
MLDNAGGASVAAVAPAGEGNGEPEHEPTAAEVQLAVIEASIAEQKRLRAHQIRHEAINDVCDGADGEGQSFIYGSLHDMSSAHKFVAWPWTGVRAGRIAALAMIVLTLVLNTVAIAVAIYLCAARGQCGD